MSNSEVSRIQSALRMGGYIMLSDSAIRLIAAGELTQAYGHWSSFVASIRLVQEMTA